MTVVSEQTGVARALSESGRPGTRFYAPEARIVDERGDSILFGGNPRKPVNCDLVSTRVTQVHHGVSQVSLTLNNQRHNDANQPLLPTWKYNRLDVLHFGQRVRVQFRYALDQKDWQPMILARITDMGFSFPSSGGSQLTLEGEDVLSLLKTKPNEDTAYRNKGEREIVEDVLRRAEFSRAYPMASSTDSEQFGDTLTTVTHQKTQTYLQFIESLAERLDYEVFVDFDDPTDKNSAVKFHFEPARSLTLKGLVDLTWGSDLVEFRPKFKVWDVFTGAETHGRDPRRRARVEETVVAGALVPDLHRAPDGATPISAIDARRRFFQAERGAVPENPTTLDVSNLDRQRARRLAVAALRKSAREFLTAEASTIGFTRIRPGIHVNIKKLEAPFDGIYYVTKAVHTADSNGFRTQCSLRRPGMLNPDRYPTG